MQDQKASAAEQSNRTNPFSKNFDANSKSEVQKGEDATHARHARMHACMHAE
jgi:hypothetical protein